MRGKDEQQLDVFSYVSPEQRVPQDHPLRPLRAMTDEALSDLQPRFNRLYAKTGRPSIAPEKLLRALLLQALYSVRSERMLMEQLDYNLLFRWFVGLNMDDAVWDVTAPQTEVVDLEMPAEEKTRGAAWLIKSGRPVAFGETEKATGGAPVSVAIELISRRPNVSNAQRRLHWPLGNYG
jgi:Transposase domain (DUF772)